MNCDLRTIEDVRNKLQAALRDRNDLCWVRFRARSPDGSLESATFRLLVMPQEAWWSWLEQEALQRHLRLVVDSRWVNLEDERAANASDFDDATGDWELILDRDPARRLEFEQRRAREALFIAEAYSLQEYNRSNYGRDLGASWYRKDAKRRFQRFIEHADTLELLGLYPEEEEWDSVSNAAQETARMALTIACDVWRFDGLVHPRSISDSFRRLVVRGLLEPDAATRLAAWLFPALHLSNTTPGKERVRLLLELPAADLEALCDVPGKAVATRDTFKLHRGEPRSRFAADSASNQGPEHQVDDFYALTCVDPEPGTFDFFISYSWQRKTDDAHALAAILTQRGYRVFLDKHELPEDTSMEKLVPTLVHAVRSSSAVILFEVLLGAPLGTLPKEREDEAIRKGHAIPAPAVGGDPLLVEWSWQTLELVAATHFLGVHDGTVFATAFQSADPDFMTSGRFASIDELASVCERYLKSRLADQTRARL